MPRYFFHIHNGTGFIEDEEGAELADEAAARARAIASARDLMTGDVRRGHLDLTAFIAVENADREPLFTLTFAEAVEIRMEQRGEQRSGRG